MDNKTYTIDVYSLNKKKKIASYAIQSADKFKKGAEAIFLDIDGKKGLKVYRWPKVAGNAFKKQKKCAEHGLAPKVFGNKVAVVFSENFLELLDEGSNLYWLCEAMMRNEKTVGYFTQVAKVCLDHGGWNNDRISVLRDKISKLLKIHFCDIAERNFGKIDGKLVAIDFGQYSGS